MKNYINSGKRTETPNYVNSVKNINKNPKSFLGIKTVQKEVPTAHKLLDHSYE